MSTVNEYIAAQPTASHLPLRRVRNALRGALPDADEVIAYGIPAYKLHGRIVVYFAGWKAHYALYPVTAALTTALAAALAPYEMSGKGTIRFPLDEAVPVTLIARIATFRAKEVAAAAAARKASRKTAVAKKR